MKEITTTEIEYINIAVLIIGSLLCITIMREFKYLFSFVVASGIMTLNFRLLKKIIEIGLLSKDRKRQFVLISLPIKFLVLAGLIGIIIAYGDIDILFFLLGLSTVFVSIVISHISHLFTLSLKRREKNGT